MSTEIKAQYTLEGADKAAQDLNKAADAAEDLGNELEKAGKKGKDAGQDVKEGVDEMKDATDAAKDAQDGLTGALDNMTGGAVSGLKNVVKGVGTFIKGLKATRMAVAATGIGALVLVIGSLVTYFTKTEKGAQLLEVATAALGGVMGVLTDAVSKVGEFLVSAFANPKQAVIDLATAIKDNIVNRLVGLVEFIPKVGEAISQVFSGDFSGAAKTAVDAVGKVTLGVESVTDAAAEAAQAVGEFGSKVADAATQAASLQQSAIDLRKAQRDLSVEFSEQRAVIAELKKTGDDVTLSIEERIAATEQAAAIELALANKRQEQAEEAIRIQQEQMALSESTEEDYERLAELEIALNEAKRETLGVQTELLMKVNGLYVEQDAKAQEAATKRAEEAQQRADLEAELALERMTAQEQEEQAARDTAADRIARAEGDADLIKQIEDQLQADLTTIRDTYQAEADAKEEERKALEAEEKAMLKEALSTEQELEMMALEEEYAKKLELARKYGEGETALEEEFEKKQKAVRDKYDKAEADARKKRITDDKAARNTMLLQTLDTASQVLSLMTQLNENFGKTDEKSAKKRFERGKKLQKAGVIASTASAIIAAVAAPPVGLGFPAGLLGAASAAVTGAVQLRNINKQQFESTSSDTPEAPSLGAATSLGGGGGGGGPVGQIATLGAQGAFNNQSAASNFAPSATTPPNGDTSTTPPMRAYVVSQEVTNTQELDSQLANSATL